MMCCARSHRVHTHAHCNVERVKGTNSQPWQKCWSFFKTRQQFSWRHERKTELFTHRVYSLYSVAPSSLKIALPAGDFGQHGGTFPSSQPLSIIFCIQFFRVIYKYLGKMFLVVEIALIRKKTFASMTSPLLIWWCITSGKTIAGRSSQNTYV